MEMMNVSYWKCLWEFCCDFDERHRFSVINSCYSMIITDSLTLILGSKTWLGLWDPKRKIKQDHKDFMSDKYEKKR